MGFYLDLVDFGLGSGWLKRADELRAPSILLRLLFHTIVVS